jgi:tetratricopeptide (TPR) repeat protein
VYTLFNSGKMILGTPVLSPRSTGFSSGSDASKELSPAQRVKLSLMDIRNDDGTKETIRSFYEQLLPSSTADETLTSTLPLEPQGPTPKPARPPSFFSRDRFSTRSFHRSSSLPPKRIAESRFSDSGDTIDPPKRAETFQSPVAVPSHQSVTRLSNSLRDSTTSQTKVTRAESSKTDNPLTPGTSEQTSGEKNQTQEFNRSIDSTTVTGASHTLATALWTVDLGKKVELADKYLRSGDIHKARNLYLEVKVRVSQQQVYQGLLDPQTRRILAIDCRVAELGIHEGHYEEAEDEFKRLNARAENHFPNDQHIRRIEIRMWLGVIFDRRGRYKEAVDQLAKVDNTMDESSCTQASATQAEFEACSVLTKNALSLAVGHSGNFAKAMKTNDLAMRIALKVSGGSRLEPVQLNRAVILTYHERYDDAKNLNLKAMQGMQRSLGTHHVRILDCWSLRACLLAVDCKMEEAEEQCVITLRRMRSQLGLDHPSTLRALGTLVWIYKAQGRLADATYTATNLVDKSKRSRALGPVHPQTLSAKNALAMVYAASGKLQMALLLQKRIVEVSEKPEGEYGVDHLTTWMYQSDLSHIHYLNGDWTTANRLARGVFLKQFENFQRESEAKEQELQKTITPSEDARDLEDSRVRENVSQLREILIHLDEQDRDSQQSKTKPIDIPPSLLSTMHTLGASERERESGDIQLSLELLTLVTKFRKQTFSDDHADTLLSDFELAKTKRSQGLLKEIAAQFAKIQASQTHLLGISHPDTLSSRHELNVTLSQLPGMKGTWGELNSVLRLRTELLGKSHPDTIKSQLDMSHLYHLSGRLDKAETLLLGALSGQVGRSDLANLNKCPPGVMKTLYVKVFGILNLPLPDSENLDPTGRRLDPSPHKPYSAQVMSTLAAIASLYSEHDNLVGLEKAINLLSAVISIQRASTQWPALSYQTRTNRFMLENENNLALLYHRYWAESRNQVYLEREPSVQSATLFDRAISLYMCVIRKTKVVDDINLTAQARLASLLFLNGQFQEAEIIQIGVLKQRERKQQRHRERERERDALRKNREETSSESEYRDTEVWVESKYNLALTQRELGKEKEALRLISEVYTICVDLLGQSHQRSVEMHQIMTRWKDTGSHEDSMTLTSGL